jgi:ankyrin repeat protein
MKPVDPFEDLYRQLMGPRSAVYVPGVVALIGANRDLAKTVRKVGKDTLLHMAAAADHLEIAQALIKAGADLDALNSAKATPLHYAVAGSNIRMVELLQQAGADVNAANAFDVHPIISAIKGEDEPMVRQLMSMGAHWRGVEKASWALFFCSAQNGLLEQVRLCILSRMPLQEEGRLVPLCGAAEKGHRSVVAALIATGANVNAQQPHTRETALHIAATQQKWEVMSDLIAAGADVNLANHEGITPLMEAARKNNTRICDLLLEHGAHHAVQNTKGMTALHIAASLAHEEACLALVKGGADINVPGKAGKRPLHSAAEGATPEFCMALIRMGADPFAVNNKGQRADQMFKNSQNPTRRENASTIKAFGESQRALKAIEDIVGKPGGFPTGP